MRPICESICPYAGFCPQAHSDNARHAPLLHYAEAADVESLVLKRRDYTCD